MPRLSRIFRKGTKLPVWDPAVSNRAGPWAQPLVDASRSSQLELKFDTDEPHFRKGFKEVYLPDFTVSLVKEPKLSPHFAKFLVPLWFSKLDLRDYLFHGYDVRAFNIRSNIVQRPYESIDWRNNTKPQRRYFRRKAIKFMTIEMDKPFVWPTPPSTSWDEEGFDKTALDANNAEREYNNKFGGNTIPWHEGSDAVIEPTQEGRSPNENKTMKDVRNALAGEAEKLLAGRAKWQPTWQTVADMFHLPKKDGTRSNNS